MRALFDNPDETLYPNQFVNARLLVNTLTNVVRVPVQAVQRGAPGTYVYVINANDTVSVRPIKIGPTDNGYDAVTSGLEPGERVVTDGTDRLSDGIKVTIPPPPATAAEGSGQSGAQGSSQPGAQGASQSGAQGSSQPAAQGASQQSQASQPPAQGNSEPSGQTPRAQGQAQHGQHQSKPQSQ